MDIASDHYLGVATLKLKLKRKVAKLRIGKPDISKVKEEGTKMKFNMEI